MRGSKWGVRRWLEAILRPDDWGQEYLDALDAEAQQRYGHSSGFRADLWKFSRVLSPSGLTFWRLQRSRRLRAKRGQGEGMMFEGWLNDVRIATRSLLRERRFAFFGSLTLALGVAGVATMFGIVDRLFLGGPEQVRAPEELVRVYLHFEEETESRTSAFIPWRTFNGVAESEAGFQAMAAYRYDTRTADLPSGVRRLQVSAFGAGYFDLLGTMPQLGRFPDADDPADRDAVVISDRLWREAFGAETSVLGTTLEMQGSVATVVGVAPSGFSGPDFDRTDLWIPLRAEAAGNRNWWVVGRLSAEVSPGSSGRDIVASRADVIHKATDPGRSFQWALDGRIVLRPLGYDNAGEAPMEADVARLLSAVCLLVLLLACVNVVNLALARMTRRTREIGVRRALGVGRARLFRSLITETLLIGIASVALSLPLAWLAGRSLRTLLFPDVAWSANPLEPTVLAAAGVTAVFAALLVGVIPSLGASRTDVQQALRSASSGGGRKTGRLHLALATSQVALAAALLLGAGLLLRSFSSLRGIELGYDEGRVAVVSLQTLDPAGLDFRSGAEATAYREALRIASASPDVESASLVIGAPFLTGFSTGVQIPGLDSIPALPGGGPWYAAVAPGFFETFGTPLMRGRTFEGTDSESRVVVISASMESTLWPNGDALGACIGIGNDDEGCYSVIGVVADVHRSGYREPPSMQYYVPIERVRGFAGTTLVARMRSGTELAALREEIRTGVQGVDLVEARMLSSFLEPEVRPWRMGSLALGLASALATLVALLGVYGVLAYLVAQRSKEISVRMALGATRASIGRMVLRTGSISAGVGLLFGGLLLTVGLRWLRPLLYETRPFDPVVISAVVGLVLLVAASACLLPARQASRVEPAGVLRGD